MVANNMKAMTRKEFLEIYNKNLPEYGYGFECIEFDREVFNADQFHFDVFDKCVFKDTTFKDSIFSEANFAKCSFINVNFINCILGETFFKSCEFKNVEFRKCDFGDAYFCLCDMRWTRIINSLVHSVDIRYCMNTTHMFTDSKIEKLCFMHSDLILFPECCPKEGEFVAWKKALLCRPDKNAEDILVKLRIPADARRTTYSVKCRASKAEVIGFEDLEGRPYELNEGEKVYSFNLTDNIKYAIGETVYPDSFDENIETCSNGIHFFYDKKEALEYERYDY